jgi:hypothetical protein
MTADSGPGPGHEREAFAAHAADVTGELALGARQHGLEALGYLLEMSHMEAKSAARSLQAAGGKKPKIAHG